jgi:hypothetical protein
MNLAPVQFERAHDDDSRRPCRCHHSLRTRSTSSNWERESKNRGASLAIGQSPQSPKSASAAIRLSASRSTLLCVFGAIASVMRFQIRFAITLRRPSHDTIRNPYSNLAVRSCRPFTLSTLLLVSRKSLRTEHSLRRRSYSFRSTQIARRCRRITARGGKSLGQSAAVRTA